MGEPRRFRVRRTWYVYADSALSALEMAEPDKHDEVRVTEQPYQVERLAPDDDEEREP